METGAAASQQGGRDERRRHPPVQPRCRPGGGGRRLAAEAQGEPQSPVAHRAYPLPREGGVAESADGPGQHLLLGDKGRAEGGGGTSEGACSARPLPLLVPRREEGLQTEGPFPTANSKSGANAQQEGISRPTVRHPPGALTPLPPAGPRGGAGRARRGPRGRGAAPGRGAWVLLFTHSPPCSVWFWCLQLACFLGTVLTLRIQFGSFFIPTLTNLHCNLCEREAAGLMS